MSWLAVMRGYQGACVEVVLGFSSDRALSWHAARARMAGRICT
jgi:hypothetical protein